MPARTCQRNPRLNANAGRPSALRAAASRRHAPALSLRERAQRVRSVPNADIGSELRARSETGAPMKHPSIRELFDYWNLRRGRRAAPDRARHRARRHPPRAGRHLHPVVRRDGRTSVPDRRHAGLRRLRTRTQERRLPRSVDAGQPPAGARSSQCRRQRSRRRRRQRARHVDARDRPTSWNCWCCRSATADAPMRASSVRWRRATPRYWLGACTLGHADARHAALSRAGAERVPPPIATGAARGRIRHGFVVYDGGQT